MIHPTEPNLQILCCPKHATIELKGVKIKLEGVQIVFDKQIIGLYDIVDAGNQFLDLIKNLK